MQQNPFLLPIAKILREQVSAISEYALLQHLNFTDETLALPSDTSGDLALFRKHFLIMNALYQLQPIFFDEGFHLEISALNITLIPLSNSQSTPTYPVSTLEIISQPGDDEIRDYYLDWGEFTQSDPDSVEKLLSSFWQRYYAGDEESNALKILGLEATADWQCIRSTYQKLASKHHPDKGGDPQTFICIREAYEQLACIRRNDSSS